MYNITKPSEETYWVAFNPLMGITHYGKLDKKSVLTTGQLLLFTSLTEREVVDMIYSEYEEVTENDDLGVDELGQPLEEEVTTVFEFGSIRLKSGTEREVLFSEYGNEMMTNTVVEAINALVPSMTISSIKHKTEDRWLVPFSEYAWNIMTPEQQAPLLEAKEEQDGHRRTKDDLTLDEWDI
jgi:hypothetical protein